MLYSLILIPFVFSVCALAVRDNKKRPMLLPVAAVIHLLATLHVLGNNPGPSPGGWIMLDAPGSLMLLIISVIFLFSSLYSVGYLAYRKERSNRILCAGLLLCLAAMSLSTMSRHLALLWVAIETTTLAMAPLIYFNRNARSVEATWKYMLICSVGIAFALLGLYFLAYSTIVARHDATLLLDTLLAKGGTLSPEWLGGAFVFLLVGFGTKVGLAPLHTWKPDAYGEAPGLVGALLAGGLVNCGLLGIIRIHQVCISAGFGTFSSNALMFVGFVSMFIGSVFIIRQADFKRLLAYSSVEHVGLVAVALGIGKGAVYGALFHLLNNSLTKCVAFLVAGNIHRSYNSKRIDRVRGALARLPWSGGIFLAAFFALSGSPPFSTFISEFMIVENAFSTGRPWAAFAVLTLLAVVFIGMTATIIPMVQGRALSGQEHTSYRDHFMTVAPPFAIIVLIVILGLWIPEPLQKLLRDAALQIGGVP